jgi:ribosomal protein S18 acetylase RimI-like enzyme
MEENKIRLKWIRETKYLVSLFPESKIPFSYGVLVKGDPFYDSQDMAVANMGVWLDSGIIYHLYVQPTWRGKHLGTKLLKEGEKKLMKMKKTRIGILVSNLNTQAINFYIRRGYTMTDEKMIGFNVMRKEIRGE